MRLALCALVILAVMLTPSSAQSTRPASATHLSKPLPNVFLITIDTLRADHIHCYGYGSIETPALDGLARDGIRFEQAFTPSPVTNTSHTSILTGLLPSSHGVTDFGVPLGANHVTLAQVLKARGYRTSAFIGAVILDSKTLAPGLDRGFDFYDNFPEHADPKSRWGRVERRGNDVVGHAEKWLTANPASPHFSWIHLYDPHDPYEPPTPFAAKYRERPYDGEIAFADSVLGSFLSYLKKQGWYDNSIIVVVGDHGEGLGEHKEDTHGIFLYDSTLHVPLIVRLPRGTRAGQKISAQVRTIDLVPTVLRLLGMESDQHFDGESLLQLISAGSDPNLVAVGETDYPLRFGWAAMRSVRTPEFKYIEAPRPELYNLRADAHETLNIYEDTTPRSSQLQRQLPKKSSAEAGVSTVLPDPKDKIEEQNLLHAAMLASDDHRSPEARDAFLKVLQLDPASAVALQGLGELEFQGGDFTEAADHLRKSREIRPSDPVSSRHEAEARQTIGDLDGAREALEASLKISPDQLQARLSLGDVYLKLNNPAAAEDQFEAAELLDSQNAAAQFGQARAQLLAHKSGEAVQTLQPLMKTSSRPEVFLLLQQAYQDLGKLPEADSAAARARELSSRKKLTKP